LTYLALNGSLGTGFREESLDAGLERPVEFIGVDSGSTDGGPFYLGSGEWIWSMAAYERDLRLGLLGARRLGIPLIIGSCGGGGNDSAVDGYLQLVEADLRRLGGDGEGAQGAFIRASSTFERTADADGLAAWQAGRTVQVIKVAGAGGDHPFLAHVQEGRYLKAVFCRVE